MERIWLIILIGLLGYLLYLIFSPFLVPLTWAIVLSIFFYPLHRRIRKRIARANLAALATTLLLTIILIAPTLVVVSAFTNQAIEGAQWLQAEWKQGRKPVLEWWQGLPLSQLLGWLPADIEQDQVRDYVIENVRKLVQFIAGWVGPLARNLLLLFFNVFVTLFAAFYLFRDGPRLMDLLRQSLPLDEAYREGLFYIAHNVLYASVFSSFVVAAVQGALGGLTFWFLGIPAPLLWGMVMGFLSLLPVLGAWLVWVPAVIFFVINAQYVKAAILLVTGALIISMADNVLRPLLISGRAQLNGLLVFISILGGIAAFGLVGIVLGPILVALGAAVLEAYRAARVRSPA